MGLSAVENSTGLDIGAIRVRLLLLSWLDFEVRVLSPSQKNLGGLIINALLCTCDMAWLVREVAAGLRHCRTIMKHGNLHLFGRNCGLEICG